MTTPATDGASKHCPHCDQPVSQAKFDEITLNLDEEAGERVIRAKLVPVRTGRPPKPPAQGERISLGLKVTADIKARLDRAAQESGRTQSQEAELRIERSFDRQDLLGEVLTLVYGKELGGLLIMIGCAMRTMDDKLRWDEGYDGWILDPAAFDQIKQSVVTVLNAVRPQRGRGRRRRPVRSGPDAGFRSGALVVFSVRKQTKVPLHSVPRDTIRSLLGPAIVHRLDRLRPPLARDPSPPGLPPNSLTQAPETSSQAVADAVLNLINSNPRTPSREEIANVVLAQLKAAGQKGGGQ